MGEWGGPSKACNGHPALAERRSSVNSEARSRLWQQPCISASAQGDAPPQTSGKNPASHTPSPSSKALIAQQQSGGGGETPSPNPVIPTEQTTGIHLLLGWLPEVFEWLMPGPRSLLKFLTLLVRVETL